MITDGSAVLGLGNIGPEAALPVMEGKCILFKEFANIDAIPVCLATQNVDEIVKTVSLISPSLGGINLEDISSPRCFLVEEKLKKLLSIPVFHDDQHGTAVVVLAATINALKIVKKKLSQVKIVINGAGAAGIAVTKFLHNAGAKDVILCDRAGTIYQGRKKNMNFAKKEIAQPEWIANGAIFLASDESRYMTGQVIIIDGGYVMDGSLPGAKYWEK